MNQIFAKYGTVIMIVVWIAIIYFFMVMPNKKKQKKQKTMMESLKEGEEIVTIGGVKGTIVRVDESFVVIKIDKGTHMTIRKSAVAVVLD